MYGGICFEISLYLSLLIPAIAMSKSKLSLAILPINGISNEVPENVQIILSILPGGLRV